MGEPGGLLSMGLHTSWTRLKRLSSSSSSHYTGLENSIDSIVHGDAKSWTQLSSFHFIYSLLALEKPAFLLLPAFLCSTPKKDYITELFKYYDLSFI